MGQWPPGRDCRSRRTFVHLGSFCARGRRPLTAETGARTLPTAPSRSELEQENAQLRTALESRIVLEQAKGILSERFRIPLDDAFDLLRRSARSSRRRIHDLAAEITAGRETPPEIERFLESAKFGRIAARVDGARARTRTTPINGRRLSR